MAAPYPDEIKLQQVAQLMQPALIRLFDQVRKHLDRSPWTGTYETVELWPEGTTEQEKQTFAQVQQNLLAAEGEQLNALEETLATLPQPQPMYLLQLSRDNQQVQVNLWELCFQICFDNYMPVIERKEIADFPISEIQVDTNLLDATGEVDWNRLDDKAQNIVEQMFKTLSTP